MGKLSVPVNEERKLPQAAASTREPTITATPAGGPSAGRRAAATSSQGEASVPPASLVGAHACSGDDDVVSRRERRKLKRPSITSNSGTPTRISNSNPSAEDKTSPPPTFNHNRSGDSQSFLGGSGNGLSVGNRARRERRKAGPTSSGNPAKNKEPMPQFDAQDSTSDFTMLSALTTPTINSLEGGLSIANQIRRERRKAAKNPTRNSPTRRSNVRQASKASVVSSVSELTQDTTFTASSGDYLSPANRARRERRKGRHTTLNRSPNSGLTIESVVESSTSSDLEDSDLEIDPAEKYPPGHQPDISLGAKAKWNAKRPPNNGTHRNSATRPSRQPLLVKGDSPDDQESSPFLLEATLVEEHDIIVAEALVMTMPTIPEPPEEEFEEEIQETSHQEKKTLTFHCRWIAAALLVFVILIVGVALFASRVFVSKSPNKPNNATSSTASSSSAVKPPTSNSTSTSRPSLRPSFVTFSPTVQNIFSHHNKSNATAPTMSPNYHDFSPNNNNSIPKQQLNQTVSPTTINLTTIAPTISPINQSTLESTNPPTDPKPYFWLGMDFLPKYTLKAISENSLSPQAKASTWLKAHPDYNNMPDWRKRQLMALMTLFYSTGGDGGKPTWNPLYSNWGNSSIFECAWEGDDQFQTKCSAEGKYQYLHIGGDSLTGPLPPEISFLSDSKSLIFRNNQLVGPLPTEIGLMTALTHITMGGNQMTGPLPSELGACTELTLLAFRGNKFTGTIPPTFANLTNLLDFQPYENSLRGTIPSFLAQMTGMETLTLFSNLFTGTIPSELLLLTKMQQLSLHNNSLTGYLPEGIFDSLTALTALRLYDNQLNGTIATSIGKLTALSELELWSNQFSGPIPSEIAMLTLLKDLDLYNNSFSGEISLGVCNFTNLNPVKLDCDLVECICGEKKCQCE